MRASAAEAERIAADLRLAEQSLDNLLPDLADNLIQKLLEKIMAYASSDLIRKAATAQLESPDELFGSWSRPDHPGAYEADILREIQGDDHIRQLSGQGATFVLSGQSRFTVKISGDDLEISKAEGKPLMVVPRQSNVILVR